MKITLKVSVYFIVLVTALFVANISTFGQEKARNASAPQLSPAAKYFTDTELVTQDGNTVRFYSDVLKGKVVVINSFFTTCQAACPVMSRTLEKIQGLLGDRVGREVYLVSISVDPVTDTPERLKSYAARFHARPGWLFLTGQPANVDFIHKKLGQHVDDKNNHLNIMIIGNEPTGLWKKASGLANPEEIYKVVESVINDKGGDAKQ